MTFVDDIGVGDVLDRRFELLDVISAGGWSSVFRARDKVNGDIVAVKVPPRYLSNVLYLREADIGQELDHPTVLRFVRVEEHTKSRPYLVTEFLIGRTLHDEIHARGLLPTNEALRIASAVCDALGYLHRHQIIHADVKPANIFLCADGSVRLIDFGIARREASGVFSSAGFPRHVGTPEYMPPEIVKGQRGDARTDVYALGAVIYEMVTGKRPFDEMPEKHRLKARLVGDPVAPRGYAPELSLQIEEIILRALARRPKERYESAAAMKTDIDTPDRVVMTARADRLEAPALARLWWPVVGLVLGSLLVPVGLFFLFLAWFRK